MRRTLILVTALTALSQLSAFFKLWFTARVFGVGGDLDGYNLALVLPTLISGVLAGVLQTGFFPVRARWATQASQDRKAAFVGAVDELERSVLFGITALGLLISALLAISTKVWGPLIYSSAVPSVQSAFLTAANFTAWLTALNLIGDCAGYLLAMRNRFAIAAGAPIANGILGGFLLSVWPEGGLLNLVLGTVLGLALQICICLAGLKAIGFKYWGKWPKWEHLRAGWREMSALGFWILPGVVFSNIVASLPTVWVASYGEGAVSAFGYAYRLHSAALQLLVMASSTLILARFSELVARNEIAAIRSALKKATIISVVLGGTGILLISAIGTPALAWIFEGRFDSSAALRVSQHWWWMTTGLAFAILGNVFAKLWQAQGRPRLISAISAISLLTLTLSFGLFRPLLHEYALAASLSASAAAVVLLGFYFTRTFKPSSGDELDNRAKQ